MSSDEALTRTLASPEFPVDRLTDQVKAYLAILQEPIDTGNGFGGKR